MFALNKHQARVQHKLDEAQHFYVHLLAKQTRYKKLAKQKAWSSAQRELNEWMFSASAFISATRSTYYYLRKATKAKDDDARWLESQERMPMHEIGKQLRGFMLHEATPNTGYEVDLPSPKPGESEGRRAVRGLFLEPRNQRIAISISEILPNLAPDTKSLASSHKSDMTALLSAILKGVEQLVAEAISRNMLSQANIGPAVSTKRLR